RRDIACDVEQLRNRAVDVADGPDKHDEQRGDRERRDEPDHERDAPQGVDGGCERHFPTATFRSARAACRIRTPESLILAMPPSSAVCRRTTSTACSAVLACPAILVASSTMTITIAAATAITTTPSAIPSCQPVE